MGGRVIIRNSIPRRLRESALGHVPGPRPKARSRHLRGDRPGWTSGATGPWCGRTGPKLDAGLNAPRSKDLEAPGSLGGLGLANKEDGSSCGSLPSAGVRSWVLTRPEGGRGISNQQVCIIDAHTRAWVAWGAQKILGAVRGRKHREFSDEGEVLGVLGAEAAADYKLTASQAGAAILLFFPPFFPPQLTTPIHLSRSSSPSLALLELL
jgi:hypothetical protein